MKISDVVKNMQSNQNANDENYLIEIYGYIFYRLMDIDQLRYFRLKGEKIIIDFDKRIFWKITNNNIENMPEKICDDDFKYIIDQYNRSDLPQKTCIENIFNLLTKTT